MPNKKTVETRIENELLDTLYRDLGFSLVASVYTALLFAYGLWPTAAENSLLLWVLAMSLISLLRASEIRYYRNNRSLHSPEEWRKRFRTLLSVSALIWAFGVYYFFPDHAPLYQAYDIFIVAGVTAGGVNSLSTDRWSARFFISAILLSLFSRLMMEGGRVYGLEAMLTLMFLALLLYLADRFYRNRYDALKMRYHYQTAANRLAESESRLKVIFEGAPAAVFYYDRDLKLLEANQTFSALLNIPPQRLHGYDLAEAPAPLTPAVRKALEEPPYFREEELRLVIGGEPLWVHLHTAAVFSRNRKILGGVGIMTDITEHIRHMEAIRHQANYDALTDLPNRTLLLEKLKEALTRLKRHRGYIAVMFLDLDNFKETNDTYGHDTGDRMLIEVSRRLQRHLRAEDTLARFGGDEFIVVLNGLSERKETAKKQAETVAQKIVESLREPLIIDGKTIETGISIGITLTDDHTCRIESLLKKADLAMYRAKKQKAPKYVFDES